ncbi:LexA family transcriptional regulator [Bizionia paragorgiae]|uniref:Bacteriophage CI repressor helix-turn-helix domain-containing protein n=1 Tax=Bizionia paragorgiae TaxID=283786 RepID=A0A1H4AV07_BIZPA|nr:S24 family peptidase [Bizionia paragorgiae]SEA39452.1 Bacteriophage CI repressor helix-turn-helix domain-containing protein [Bizionia paragorgiae]
MSREIDKNLILNDLKSHYNFKSSAEFARFLEIKPQTLASWYARNTFDIDLLYAKCEGIDGNWLLSGEGEMILEEGEDNMKSVKNGEPNAVFKLKSDNELKDQEIPLYNIEAAAGLVSLFQSNSDNKPIDTLKIPNLPKCDGAVFVTGDSMYPLLKSGDIVVYKQINDFSSDIFWGEMYLISVEVAGEEYISVKYIQKSDLGERYIKLVSQNQHHQSKDVELNKVRAMALVKASVRINSMG